MCYSNWNCKHFDVIADQIDQERFYSGALLRSMYPKDLDDWEYELAVEADNISTSNAVYDDMQDVVVDGSDLEFEDGDVFVIENSDGSFTEF